jgi:hypothetical protein
VTVIHAEAGLELAILAIHTKLIFNSLFLLDTMALRLKGHILHLANPTKKRIFDNLLKPLIRSISQDFISLNTTLNSRDVSSMPSCTVYLCPSNHNTTALSDLQRRYVLFES